MTETADGPVRTTGLCGAPVPPHGPVGHPCRRASVHGWAGPADDAGAVLSDSARRPSLDSEMLRASFSIRAQPFLALQSWYQRLVAYHFACWEMPLRAPSFNSLPLLSGIGSSKPFPLCPCPFFSVPADWAPAQRVLPALRFAN